MHDEVDNAELHRQAVAEEEWDVRRTATIYEVALKDGRIRYNVQVIDEGRELPFIDMWFGQEKAARDFVRTKLKTKGGRN